MRLRRIKRVEVCFICFQKNIKNIVLWRVAVRDLFDYILEDGHSYFFTQHLKDAVILGLSGAEVYTYFTDVVSVKNQHIWFTNYSAN